jgi:hypothetical protein
MAETLKILEDSNFIIRYTVDNKEYGYIPTFLKHQRISGEEGKQPAKYPLPPNDAGQTQEGRRSDAGQTQEGSTNVEGSCPGKGKGIRERERERKPESPPFQPFVKISGETTEKDFAMIFEEVKSKWKEAIGQETKETLFTVSPVKRERFINTLAAYSLADIFNAIGNYRIVRNDPERYDPGGRIYGNLIGFLENGVSQFFKDEAVEFNFKRRKT